jgi:hypothetical protein
MKQLSNKLLFALPARDAEEEHRIRKLANSRHAPADWIRRAQTIVLSWQRFGALQYLLMVA